MTILGASSSKKAVATYELWAADLARTVVAKGGNVVTGCGNSGIMGSAFGAARDAAKLEGAGENLSIMKTPLWGDEDFGGGRAIGVASSEEARLAKFLEVSAHVVVFPGGAGTLLETAKLVFTLAYPEKDQALPEKVVFVGGDEAWAGLKVQLESMVAAGQLKPAVLARLVFVDDAEALLREAMPPVLSQNH